MSDGWEQVRPSIRPGEQVLWVGRPDPAVRFTPADGFVVPFSVLWCGFAVFWETAAIASGAPIPFYLFGLPFIAIGLYMVFGRFILKARRKRETVYALTSQRALVTVGTGSLADSPVAYQPVATHLARDGQHASITIGNTGGWGRQEAMYANTGLDFFRRGPAPVAFYDVPNPQTMLAALDHARRPPGGPLIP